MTYYLLHNDGHALLATDRPVLKAAERTGLSDASALLAATHALHEDAAARARAAEQAARERGLAEGREEGRAAFLKAIAELTRQVNADRAEQETRLASLALAALRCMTSDIGEEAMLEGLARRAVASVLPAGAVEVSVAPAFAGPLGEAFAASDTSAEASQPAVRVRADPALAAHQCRIVTASGRVIADLDHQIAAIAQRWGNRHVD
ncbi:FliH/SctL family protein [Novosphingobium beihaiensis]|uniref:Flagellar assembly protein FliH n=1 Tax=Novosphingobium beihaiensis TaxID=2930389 RepID=A0ABT0BW39_9SPHN|nr:hypothetical protein [Novosphingobium beihaiensis]MCJ2189093.1 hypothetical protein [Novosphingobium beihaiensis]